MKRIVFVGLIATMLALASTPAVAEVGEVWEELSSGRDNPFAGREGVAMAEFQGKLWGTGGRSFGCACEPWPGEPCDCGFVHTYYDDLWVSHDGKTWELVLEHAPSGNRFGGTFFI